MTGERLEARGGGVQVDERLAAGIGGGQDREVGAKAARVEATGARDRWRGQVDAAREEIGHRSPALVGGLHRRLGGRFSGASSPMVASSPAAARIGS